MEYSSLHEVLADHFGEDSEIEDPEDVTEAWRAIVYECRDGYYPGLAREIKRLLGRPDQEIFDFLRSCAPAWECGNPAEARNGLTVFLSYVEVYS